MFSLNKKEPKKVIFVGMSGGVDSSVSAYLLQKAGHTVVGVFIKVWHPDFLPCHWEQERLDAMRVAAHLGIPFFTCDAEEAYKNDVADYFIREYKAGRTPNPDVMCNTHVKFGRFYEFARERGADAIATGHYARTEIRKGKATLLRGVDTAKDQSYFLWNVRDEVLAHTLFPIGGMTKTEVRAIAARAKLPTATKRESQGVCFLGHVDIPEFLGHYLTLTPGPVSTPHGEVIGSHDGIELYTIGQRHGFSVSHGETPYYIVAKNQETNTLIVSPDKPQLTKKSQIVLANGSCDSFSQGREVCMQTRYRQTPTRIRLEKVHKDSTLISVLEDAEFPALGQSCVLYDRDVVLGGGIIEGVRM